MQTTVSVIVTVTKTKYFEYFLKSLKAQTIDFDVTFAVFCDYEKVKGLLANFQANERTKLLNLEGVSLIDGLKRAIISAGENVLIVDGNDYLTEKMLEKMLETKTRTKVGVVLCEKENVYEKKLSTLDFDQELVDFNEKSFFSLFEKGHINSINAKLFDKNLLLSCLNYVSASECLLNSLKSAKKFGAVKDCSYYEVQYSKVEKAPFFEYKQNNEKVVEFAKSNDLLSQGFREKIFCDVYQEIAKTVYDGDLAKKEKKAVLKSVFDDEFFQTALPFGRGLRGRNKKNYNLLKGKKANGVLFLCQAKARVKRFYDLHLALFFCKLKNHILKPFYKKNVVLTSEQTVDYILAHGCSLSRFGDGEMGMMQGDFIGFQSQNKNLADALKKVEPTKDLLVCVPKAFTKQDRKNMTANAKFFWKRNLAKHEYLWRKKFGKAVCGNTQFSRFYLDYKSFDFGYVEKLKKLWQDRKIVFVEGANTRLGVNNDLFLNAKSIERIVCPSKNAFDKYDEILAYICQNVEKDKLLVLALGPTATVLSSDLSKAGYQALDVGHIDVEYEWAILHADKKLALPAKFVNEVSGGKNVANFWLCDDYFGQITKDFTAEN